MCKCLNELQNLLMLLLMFNGFDLLSAFPKIIKEGYKSKTMREGITSKIMIYLAIAVAFGIDYTLNDNCAISKCVLLFYVANEGLSILENVGKVAPLPKIIVNFLQDLKHINDESLKG